MHWPRGVRAAGAIRSQFSHVIDIMPTVLEVAGLPAPTFDDDVWELYDTRTDWSQAHDIAADYPGKLHELQRLWLIEATRHGVLPMDDRRAERFDPDTAGRPKLARGNRQRFFAGMGRLSENSVVSIKNKSHAVTAEVVVNGAPAQGVIIAQVTTDYPRRPGFTGDINWVEIAIGDDAHDADHFCSPDEQLRIAIARQ